MSTKGTVFLTKDNEHCYDETMLHDGDKFRLVLEIGFENIKDFSYDSTDGLIIDIAGDSELANIIRSCKGELK